MVVGGGGGGGSCRYFFFFMFAKVYNLHIHIGNMQDNPRRAREKRQRKKKGITSLSPPQARKLVEIHKPNFEP